MPRKKGSKNKPKETHKEEPKAKPEVRGPQGHPIAYVSQETKEGRPPERKEWKPEPTLEKKVEKKKGECGSCHHHDDVHYGTKDRWCNTPNCTCQGFK